ncbi:carboxymuconolactone decarboxylase family protein [Sabulilitoribacter multivorans]|uniref:Carboxymuconolactone decarboxylase family protein n=1 Tax=Flaviramulus multivorans TaxID=1304750 RepID=A0ABS9IJE2_9FLAO|nr:carboxymuconolactone decarboxylase family protein [Flaviramulus multivorans]MCF7560707.1 carboxymuconolactone decarboxylase family protein [Flaviramulus multivorans]
MKTITVPTINEVNNDSKQIFDSIKKQIGMLPNVYAVTGYSSESLALHINMTNKAGKGSFSNKELEAIKLAVSQVNGCHYCLSAHTAIAKMNGFTDEEALSFRQLTSNNSKLNVLTRLAAEIVTNRGRASEELLEEFYNLGYSEKALVDLVLVITDITFTNYLNEVAKVPIDFPKVELELI